MAYWGEERVVKRFQWLPCRLYVSDRGSIEETRWLCWVYVRQTYDERFDKLRDRYIRKWWDMYFVE